MEFYENSPEDGEVMHRRTTSKIGHFFAQLIDAFARSSVKNRRISPRHSSDQNLQRSILDIKNKKFQRVDGLLKIANAQRCALIGSCINGKRERRIRHNLTDYASLLTQPSETPTHSQRMINISPSFRGQFDVSPSSSRSSRTSNDTEKDCSVGSSVAREWILYTNCQRSR